MTAFVIAIIVLLLLALAFVVPVMLRNNQLEEDTRDQQNIQIAKDRLAELKQELELGNISQAEFDQVKQELENTLALDLSTVDDAEVTAADKPVMPDSKLMAVVLAIAIPALAVLLYAEIGAFNTIGKQPEVAAQQPHAQQSQSQMQPPQMSMEEAISKLRQRLEAEPDNAEGWFMLARTYAVTNEYGKAIEAYQKVLQLVGENDAGLLLRYADALAMNEGGKLSGAAYDYVGKALAIDPQNPQGLWMMGMAQNERGEYRQALESWYQVLPQLQDAQAENELGRMIAAVENNVSADVITEIREKYSVSAVAENAGGAAAIQVTVSLDESLKDKVSATDTVFIFARAVSGPPMPLAAVKHQVSALPVTVTLNDAMAMMPAMKLSQYEQVTVGAKISKSGSAGPAAGDLFGEQSPVNVMAGESVQLLINQVR